MLGGRMVISIYLSLDGSILNLDKVLAFFVTLGIIGINWLKWKSLGDMACFFLLGALDTNHDGKETSSSTLEVKTRVANSWHWMLVVTIGGVEVTTTSGLETLETWGGTWVSNINLSKSSNIEDVTSNKLGRNIVSKLSWGL